MDKDLGNPATVVGRKALTNFLRTSKPSELSSTPRSKAGN